MGEESCALTGRAEDVAHLAIERGLIHFHEPVYSVLALVSYFVDSIYVNLQQNRDNEERNWAAGQKLMAHRTKNV